MFLTCKHSDFRCLQIAIYFSFAPVMPEGGLITSLIRIRNRRLYPVRNDGGVSGRRGSWVAALSSVCHYGFENPAVSGSGNIYMLKILHY
jgi:hypothetical protein